MSKLGLAAVALVVMAGCEAQVAGEPDAPPVLDAGPDAPAPDVAPPEAAPPLDAGPPVDSVVCEEDMGGGTKTIGNWYCGTGGIYVVTLGNGETCDATHKPHACPSGTACVVSGGDVAIVGVCP